ncbi:MAG: tRNA 2-thiouridine(34) synthase MnmA [Chloroflexi bacterium]|nr:tRNA 2-thiouridine(34) synthase MnmA [Chloroflexota bacterium]
MARVLVAMSGGVDSSVAAALAQESGDEAVGVWMRLHDGAGGGPDARAGRCTVDAAEDARRVAGQLGIPFHVLDLRREFAEAVVRPFVAAYLDGRTPSPCLECNTLVKFGALLGRARQRYGCEAVVTGHYARIEVGHGPDGRRLLRLRRARDAAKDQAYFLHGLGQDQLAHGRFPLGELTKAEVRELARTRGLASAARAESMEVCFVPGGDLGATLAARGGWTAVPGPVVDSEGRVIGRHAGAAAYTTGQRRGTGVATGRRCYVRGVDPAHNTLVVGPREDLETAAFVIEDASFVAGSAPPAPFAAQVQVRHRATPVPARVSRLSPGDSGRWLVETEQPVWAATPGQAAVLFDGEYVLGGGRIARESGPGAARAWPATEPLRAAAPRPIAVGRAPATSGTGADPHGAGAVAAAPGR